MSTTSDEITYQATPAGLALFGAWLRFQNTEASKDAQPFGIWMEAFRAGMDFAAPPFPEGGPAEEPE